jgi:DNA-binding transcriptional ArsR family regulator
VLKYSELDLAFQALGDPTRRAMVEQLTLGPASVSELAAPLPMSLPAVHQHLKVLEHSGLVRSEKVGRVRTCRLELTMLDTVQSWIDARRATWERRLNRLDTYLATLPPETPTSTTREKEQP